MPLKHYPWDEGEIAAIEEHSLAKHRILREYVLDYIRILTSNPRQERIHLDIVDGFAGGGTYLMPNGSHHYGSPVVLLRALDEGVQKVNQARRKPLSLTSKAYFVEKEASTYALLGKTLTDVGLATDNRIVSVHGEFSQELARIIADIKKRRARTYRAIFVLDQYGYSDVTIADLRNIFSELPCAEVFMTLAVDCALAYQPDAHSSIAELGRVLLSDPSEREVLRALFQGEITEKQLGPDTDLGRKTRFLVQVYLRNVFTQAAGVRFYTPFFIKAPTSHRSYWFCHLANSPRAHDVVKLRHWAEQNSFLHTGGAGLNMLGYDPRRPPQGLQTAFMFDESAQKIQHRALLDELPAQVRKLANANQVPFNANQIPFSMLYELTCNDTPATKEHIAEAVNELCAAGELAKCSAHQGRRGTATAVADDDLISIPRQGNLFVDFGF